MNTMKRTTLLLAALLTLCVLTASALLVRHFVQLNYEYIVNPETSPGYSEGTPFGDGGDVWRVQGIYLPTALLAFLVVFNEIGIVMHFRASPCELCVFLIVSVAAMFVVVAAVLLDISPLYIFFILFSFIFMFPALLSVPAGIVCAIIFLARKKPLLAGHTALLTLSLAASGSLEWFSFCLYLD